MIVKVQRPLFTAEPVPMALIYTRNREYKGYFAMTAELVKTFEKHGLESYMKAKFFAEGHMKDGIFVFKQIFDEDLGW